LNSHETIRNPHRSDDHDIHQQRDADHVLVEKDELLVLVQPVLDEVCFDNAHKVEIQEPIDEQVKDLLDPVPDVVDVDPSDVD
jgi:hypothetical protein